MRLIDADELRAKMRRVGYSDALRHVDAAPTIDTAATVDVPQPLTRDGVLSEVARIEATGDTAVVERQNTYTGGREPVDLTIVKDWPNPDVPRLLWVRVVPAVTEWVPLTRLVGRTIRGETEAVAWVVPTVVPSPPHWEWRPGGSVSDYRPFPDGTLDLDSGRVEVLAEGDA